MDPNLDDLARQLATLSERFTDLGAKLAEAARELQDAGAPPSDALVEELAAARDQFVDLRRDVLGLAESLALPAPPATESLKSLEPLLEAAGKEIAARVRRAALAETRQTVLAVLDRVVSLIHQDDANFASLGACQAKAREARDAVMAITDPDSPEAQTFGDRAKPFADFLTMVEGREQLDDDEYGRLEDTVVKAFDRPLAVAAARGRLVFPGMERPPAAPEPAPSPPEPVPAAPEPVAPVVEEPLRFEREVAPPEPAPAAPEPVAPVVEEPLRFEREVAPAAPAPPPPVIEEPLRLEREVEPAPVVEPVAAPAAAEPEPVEAAAPDESAQWWLAAWARWSGWKGSMSFAGAVKEELGKYPYLLAVPIQQSTDHEDGLLAYGYSIILEHVEKQKPGCVNNALNSLKAGQRRPVGEQLYEYLVTEGKLAQTYHEFVKNVLLASLPEPGVWFQGRLLESKDDTRLFQRTSDRLGETDQTGKRLSADSARFTDHKFTAQLAPLTARYFLVSGDLKENRGVDVRLTVDGAGSDCAWLVTVPSAGKSGGKIETKRLAAEGMPMPGLGKDYAQLWIALFNNDPAAEKRYDLSLTLKKDARTPFKAKT